MNKRYQCTIRGCLGLPVFLLYIFLFCNFSRAAIEHQPKPSVRSDNDVDNDQRKSLLPRSRNKNQITSKIGSTATSRSNAQNRRDQSNDLKKLIQELEESDYSNYGSWGNFRQRQPVVKNPDTRSRDSSRIQNPNGDYREEDTEDGNMVYHSNEDDDSETIVIEEKEIDLDNAYQRNNDDMNYKDNLNRKEGIDGRREYDNSNIRNGASLQKNPYRDQNEKSLTVDLFHQNSYNQKDLYEYWLHQQQKRLITPSTITDKRLNSLNSVNVIQFDSILKVTFFLVICTFLSYFSVAPNTLPLIEYNKVFKDNLLRIGKSFIWPVLLLSKVYIPEYDLNSVVSKFLFSSTIGYISLYLIETVAATAVRLFVLRLFEPRVFKIFCPKIPAIFLPWQLSENSYFPNYMTLVLFSFLNTCIMSPVIEEGFKYLIFKFQINDVDIKNEKNDEENDEKLEIDKNVNNVKNNGGLGWGWRDSKGNKKDAKIEESTNISDMHIDSIDQEQKQEFKKISTKAVKNKIMNNIPTSTYEIRIYMITMIVISLGIKVADNLRRILLYTHRHQKHKSFFAISRSFFPVQELCGAMTALAYAKKNILGYKMSTFQVLFPSMLLHAMANFRGMKPIYIWASNRPWDELQLQAWNAIDDTTPTQMITKTALNLFWYIYLARHFSNLMKEYIQIMKEYLSKLKEIEMEADKSNIFQSNNNFGDFNGINSFHDNNYVQNERNFIENKIENSSDVNDKNGENIDDQIIMNTGNHIQNKGDNDNPMAEQLKDNSQMNGDNHIDKNHQKNNNRNHYNNDYNNDYDNTNNINNVNNFNSVNGRKNQINDKYQNKNKIIDDRIKRTENLSLVQKPKNTNSNLKNKKGGSKNGVYPAGSGGKKSSQEIVNYDKFKIYRNANDDDNDETDDNYDDNDNNDDYDNYDNDRNKDVHKSINHNYYYYQNNEK